MSRKLYLLGLFLFMVSTSAWAQMEVWEDDDDGVELDSLKEGWNTSLGIGFDISQ